MIEINLLPEDLRRKEPVRLALPEIPIKKTLIGAAAAIVALQALLFVAAFGFRLRAGWLDGRITAMRSADSEVFAKKTETLLLQTQLKELRAATSRKFHWSKLTNALTASMTRGVWLRSLSVKMEEVAAPAAGPPALPGSEEAKKQEAEKKAAKAAPARMLVLEGSAVGAGQETAFIGKFLQSLKDSPIFTEIFSDIQLSDIQQRRIEQTDAYDFLIYCKFRPEMA